MALIECPECGKQVSDMAVSCPNCGYSINQVQPANESSNVEKTQNDSISQEVKKENRFSKFIDEHKKIAGIGMLVTAVMFIIIIIAKLSSDKYQSAVENLSYYKSQYDECMSNSYGFLGSSYKAIADQWKDMIKELNFTIWSSRIIAFILAVVDIPLIRNGIKAIKKAKEETNNGIDNLS